MRSEKVVYNDCYILVKAMVVHGGQLACRPFMGWPLRKYDTVSVMHIVEAHSSRRLRLGASYIHVAINDVIRERCEGDAAEPPDRRRWRAGRGRFLSRLRR